MNKKALIGHPKDWTQTLDDDLWLGSDEQGAEEAAFLKKALHLKRGQSVLDAPCGAGRVAIHLAHVGCNVTGVDLRKSFTDRAEKRFKKEKQRGRFVAVDLRELAFSGEFCGIFCWAGSFGYFSEAENLDVMRRFANALRRGGRLLIQQVNREYVLRKPRPIVEWRNVVKRNWWDAKPKRIESEVSEMRDGKRVVRGHTSLRLYTPGEMTTLFEKVGLQVEAAYGGTNSEAYSRGSRNLIVVGRKA